MRHTIRPSKLRLIIAVGAGIGSLFALCAGPAAAQSEPATMPYSEEQVKEYGTPQRILKATTLSATGTAR